ncbi:hypothetical protein UlMin_002395 [Ulmus minor]
MCLSAAENAPPRFLYNSTRTKRSKLQLHFLNRRRYEEKVGKDMEVMNLKLYLENKTMIEENEKLRKKAILLRQENLALLSLLQNK